MFSIVLFSLIYQHKFSVALWRSKNVVILSTNCYGSGAYGKIVIQGASNRFEEEFSLGNLPESVYGSNSYSAKEQTFSADLEENSTVFISLFQRNQIEENYNFVWNSKDIIFQKSFNCFTIQIYECSSNVPASEFKGTTNCQSLFFILPENAKPFGYLALSFKQNNQQDDNVLVDSKWEAERFSLKDFDNPTKSIGLTVVWDIKQLYIKIGNEEESQLHITKPGERQIFPLRKITIFYIPYEDYVKNYNLHNKNIYYYILSIKNTDNRREKYVLADEILIGFVDQRTSQPQVALNRKLRRLLPGNMQVINGQLKGVSEAQNVIVQIKSCVAYQARYIHVLPILHHNIADLDRQIVISGSTENFFAILVLSKEPIRSLTESYLVVIKTSPTVLKFKFCVKNLENFCQFQDTMNFEYYQQVSVALNPTQQLVLKSGNTEWIISTNFRTDETTKSIDMAGVQVEVNIRRMSQDENNAKWSYNDDKILWKWSSRAANKNPMAKKNF